MTPPPDESGGTAPASTEPEPETTPAEEPVGTV